MPGDAVVLNGLKKQKMNDASGTLRHWDNNRQRWLVDIEGTGFGYIRTENMKKTGGAKEDEPNRNSLAQTRRAW